MSVSTARQLFLGLFLCVAAFKVYLAVSLSLFSDEAFYWLSAQHPALHYADHPFVNAILVLGGTTIAGDTIPGVRLLHLTLALFLPFLIYSHAKPVAGERDAWLAAAIGLAIPGFAITGFLAIPEVPLAVCTLLLLTGIERGVRVGTPGPWLMCGLAAATGLATHYRFSVAIVAATGFMVFTRAGRHALSRPWPWAAAVIASLGLIPFLLHNLATDFQAVRYYLGGRHDESLRLTGFIEHLTEQLGIASPILYIMLLVILVVVIRRALRGDQVAALHAWFAAVPITVFMFASVLHNVDLVTAHWPLVGYMALLPFAPDVLARLADRRLWRQAIAISGPALGVFFVVMILAGLTFDWKATVWAMRPFRGWPEAAAMVEAELETAPAIQIVVADNYKLGSSLAFSLGKDVELYILDHEKNRGHGRQPQFPEWRMGEAALAARCGIPAVVAVGATETLEMYRDAWVDQVLSKFESPELANVVYVPEPGNARVLEYRVYRTSGARCIDSNTSVDAAGESQ